MRNFWKQAASQFINERKLTVSIDTILKIYKMYHDTFYYGNFDNEEGYNWLWQRKFEKEFGNNYFEMENLADDFSIYIHRYL